MGGVIALLGWMIALSILGAAATFFLKQIGRDYVKKLPVKYAGFADSYRNFMKFMIRRHRYFGLAALSILPVHAGLVISQAVLSLTGLLAACALVTTAAFGIYGFYLKKNMRSGWLPLHRVFGLLLFLAMIVHIFFKGYFYLE